jgi:hypothetical protein
MSHSLVRPFPPPPFAIPANRAYLVFDQPSTKITKDFLLTGVLPTARNSSQVTVYTPGMKRGPISDPYDVPTGPEAGDVDSGALVQIPF